jgi:SAM-dependent methyltransferase
VTADASYRSNDPVYFGDQHYEEPKEYFKRVIAAIARIHGEGPLSLVDAGCATGAFLDYARSQLELSDGLGFDISDQHLEQARAHVPDIEFVRGSILELDFLGGRTFDVCTCLGTAAIFDDLETVLRNLLSLANESGSVFIYDLVNDAPVDVISQYRRVDVPEPSWAKGFNSWSTVTYERLAASVEPRARVTFEEVELPFALPYRDPLRAWTIHTERRPHQLIVGTNQLLDFRIVHIARR